MSSMGKFTNFSLFWSKRIFCKVKFIPSFLSLYLFILKGWQQMYANIYIHRKQPTNIKRVNYILFFRSEDFCFYINRNYLILGFPIEGLLYNFRKGQVEAQNLELVFFLKKCGVYSSKF